MSNILVVNQTLKDEFEEKVENEHIDVIQNIMLPTIDTYTCRNGITFM